MIQTLWRIAACALACSTATLAGEGEGPYPQLILRNLMLISGTGAPAIGRVDIFIEGNRIAKVVAVGAAKGATPQAQRPVLAAHGREMDLSEHYALPGLIDMHAHVGMDHQGVFPEYIYKLWLAHGITTIREPGCGRGIDWCVAEARRSERNEITAPRIFPYVFFRPDPPLTRPEQARRWVRDIKAKGAAGMKCVGDRPDILQAAFEELQKQGLRSACHHAQLDVTRVNVLTTARWGLTSMEHWYGLPEALFVDRTVQDYPPSYNYNDEQDRFRHAGRLWAQAAPRGSKKYEAVIQELIGLDFTLDPTFNIYAATRDLMRARRAEWLEEYTLPGLWDFFTPSQARHGSFFFDWGTEDEVAWRENYRLWMAFVNDYKNRGGRVTVGSDAGYLFQLYGFATIGELEMLREAGFHPLEVIRAATLSGAEALGAADRLGSIEPGKLADLFISEENPLANFKVLYGTGHLRWSEDGKGRRVGGVKYTIKDGIVYDAKRLLQDVHGMVKARKSAKGSP